MRSNDLDANIVTESYCRAVWQRRNTEANWICDIVTIHYLWQTADARMLSTRQDHSIYVPLPHRQGPAELAQYPCVWPGINHEGVASRIAHENGMFLFPEYPYLKQWRG